MTVTAVNIHTNISKKNRLPLADNRKRQAE